MCLVLMPLVAELGVDIQVGVTIDHVLATRQIIILIFFTAPTPFDKDVVKASTFPSIYNCRPAGWELLREIGTGKLAALDLGPARGLPLLGAPLTPKTRHSASCTFPPREPCALASRLTHRNR
jgi:hypothetical protein